MAEDDVMEKSTEPTEGNESPDDKEEEHGEMDDDDFAVLNLQLDELSSALDALEQKNDHIHAQLVKLLESNRETRQLFQTNLTDEQKSDPQI